jgi:hypothetical protein
MTPWLVYELRGRALDVTCLDARHARAALKMQINKRRLVVSGNARLHLADTCQCPVPAQLQLCRHQTIGGIGRVVLPDGAIGGVAYRFQVPDQGVADLVATRRFLRVGLDCCGNGAWLNNFQDRRFNGIVHPQAAEGDATRLTIAST